MSGHFDDDMPLRLPQVDARSQGAQCWICPHCFDDAHHHSDAQGCGRQAAYEMRNRVQIGPLDV